MDFLWPPNTRKKVKWLLGRLISEVVGIPTRLNGVFSFSIAVFTTLITTLYGGWSVSLSLLFVLVVGDFLTGMAASVKEGTGLKSKIGSIGIAKKAVIFFMVLVGHKLDTALQINIAMNLIIYFYITNELISLGENAERMGVPVPQQLVAIIELLKGKSKN